MTTTTEKTGLFITRAQPFHRGHLDGIQQAVEQGITKVLIGVGSSNKEFTSDNPFTYEERKTIIELMTKNLLQTIQVEIIPVPDVGDNTRWKEYLLKELPEFQYMISGNAWVQEIFRDTDKEIIPLSVREMVKGSTLREQLARGKSEALKADLSPEVVAYLERIHAYERLREIFNKERKVPGLTADIVLFDAEGKLILIERKNYPKGIALPGGFVDVWEKVANAAKREAKEELDVDIDNLEYLGYWDDPERDPRAHNIAHAFYAKTVKGEPIAGDDAKAVVRVHPTELGQISFAFPDHREMILKALEMRKGGTD